MPEGGRGAHRPKLRLKFSLKAREPLVHWLVSTITTCSLYKLATVESRLIYFDSDCHLLNNVTCTEVYYKCDLSQGKWLLLEFYFHAHAVLTCPFVVIHLLQQKFLCMVDTSTKNCINMHNSPSAYSSRYGWYCSSVT